MDADDNGKSIDIKKYRGMIGSLLYLTASCNAPGHGPEILQTATRTTRDLAPYSTGFRLDSYTHALGHINGKLQVLLQDST